MGTKEVGESCERGAARVAGGAHDGVDIEAVKAIAQTPDSSLTGFDPIRQALFLQTLAAKPIVGRAAKAAGVTVGACYAMRKRSDVFAAAWDEALIQGVDTLEDRAYDRAMDKSDKLLELLLKGLRPETYREKVDAMAAMRVNIVVDLVPFESHGGEAGDIDAEGFEVLQDEGESDE